MYVRGNYIICKTILNFEQFSSLIFVDGFLMHCSNNFPVAHRVRNLKFATYLKFATCENTNKINELW